MKQELFAIVYHEDTATAPSVRVFDSHEAAQGHFIALVLSLIVNYCNMLGSYDGMGRDEIQLGIDLAHANTTEERSQVVDSAASLLRDWFPDDEIHFVRATDYIVDKRE